MHRRHARACRCARAWRRAAADARAHECRKVADTLCRPPVLPNRSTARRGCTPALFSKLLACTRKHVFFVNDTTSTKVQSTLSNSVYTALGLHRTAPVYHDNHRFLIDALLYNDTRTMVGLPMINRLTSPCIPLYHNQDAQQLRSCSERRFGFCKMFRWRNCRTF